MGCLMESLRISPLTGIGEIRAGDDVARELIAALERGGHAPKTGDVLVVTHKIVSKAEGREIPLDSVTPSSQALALSEKTKKPPELVQLIIEESEEIIMEARGILICRSRLGWTCANAGVDQSNVLGERCAVLLPVDPDKSARELSERIGGHFGCRIALIISDTHGRPLREGIVGVAIGCSGIDPMRSYIGKADRAGRLMKASIEAVADELAAAASILMGQGSESVPAVLVQGYDFPYVECGAEALKRDRQREFFTAKTGGFI